MKKALLSDKNFFIVTGMAPLLLVLIGLTVYPFIMNVYMSLVDYNFLSSTMGKFMFFRNYRAILVDPSFWIVLRNTLLLTLGAVTVQLILGLMVASIFASFKAVHFLRPIITLPMAAASIAVAYSWIIMMDPTVGLVTVVLRTFGFETIETFTNPKAVIPLFILIDTWRWAPFMIIIFLGQLLSLPNEPYEAAELDGASGAQTFIYITLPFIKNTILFAVMIRVIDTFKIFDEIFIITKGGPGRASETLSIYNFTVAFDRLRMGEGAALSILVLILQLFVALTIIRRSNIYTVK
jgi:multiple sugar transport system permease protein